MSGWFGWFKKMVCWMGQKKITRSCFCRWKHTESDSQTAKRPVTVRLCGGCLLDWVEHDLAGGAFCHGLLKAVSVFWTKSRFRLKTDFVGIIDSATVSGF
jgi:hypothetical protein